MAWQRNIEDAEMARMRTICRNHLTHIDEDRRLADEPAADDPARMATAPFRRIDFRPWIGLSAMPACRNDPPLDTAFATFDGKPTEHARIASEADRRYGIDTGRSRLTCGDRSASARATATGEARLHTGGDCARADRVVTA